jgi:hypothetical protein
MIYKQVIFQDLTRNIYTLCFILNTEHICNNYIAAYKNILYFTLNTEQKGLIVPSLIY